MHCVVLVPADIEGADTAAVQREIATAEEESAHEIKVKVSIHFPTTTTSELQMEPFISVITGPIHRPRPIDRNVNLRSVRYLAEH